MGTGTFVNEMQAPARSAASRERGFDLPLLAIVVALVIFGLVMLFSASWDFSLLLAKPATYMFSRQLVWLMVGCATALALSFLDYHHWRRWIVPAMLATIFLLVGVLLMNEIRLGAKRSYFEGSVQPSELAKLISILYLAVWL